MTMNLITGKAGAPHITSSDQGAMQAGLVGNGNYLLQGGDGKFPAVTMQSANKALIPVLNLVIEGHMMLQIGDKQLFLNEGDSIYFDANRPHGMKALDGKRVQFLAIII